MMVIKRLPRISHLLCSIFTLNPPGKRKGVNILPDDILIDILSRLPAPTILRCRAVCRRWRALTSSTYFIAVIATRAPFLVLVQGVSFPTQKTTSRYYIYDAASKELRSIPLKLISYGLHVPYLHGACGPLLHLKGHEFKADSRVDTIERDIVFNLITRQQQALPITEGRVCGMYFHTSTNEFNLLYVRYLSAQKCYQYSSYNLVSGNMKEIACSHFSCWPSSVTYPVVFKQALYFMASPSREQITGSCMPVVVMVFELDSERLSTFPLPDLDSPGLHKDIHLFVHDGHLGLVLVHDLHVGLFDIWRLEDHANWLWVRESTLCLQKPVRLSQLGYTFKIFSVGKDELFIYWFSSYFLVVNLKQQAIKEIKLPHKMKSTALLHYVA